MVKLDGLVGLNIAILVLIQMDNVAKVREKNG